MPGQLETIVLSPENIAEPSGIDIVLPCKTSDGSTLDWAKSDDRGISWVNIARGDQVIDDPEKYEVDTTEDDVITPGVYHLRILGLDLEDAAIYRCQHWILSENAYAHVIALGNF